MWLCPYRVFVRDAQRARGFGGRAVIRRYVLECEGVGEEVISMLLAHDMGVPLGGCDGPRRGDWVVLEGVVEVDACFVPVRFGLRNKEWVKEIRRMAY